jgi:hypothetical protein
MKLKIIPFTKEKLLPIRSLEKAALFGAAS